jgi:DNA-directed RNA polymerase specialized sigma24 family protein
LPRGRGGLEGSNTTEKVTDVVERLDSLRTWPVEHENRGFWNRLWAHLVAWVRRRTRPPIEAEEVASETVLRAIECLGQQPCRPWPAVWTWSTSTAMHLVFATVRAECKLRLRYEPEVDHWVRRELPSLRLQS